LRNYKLETQPASVRVENFEPKPTREPEPTQPTTASWVGFWELAGWRVGLLTPSFFNLLYYLSILYISNIYVYYLKKLLHSLLYFFSENILFSPKYIFQIYQYGNDLVQFQTVDLITNDVKTGPDHPVRPVGPLTAERNELVQPKKSKWGLDRIGPGITDKKSKNRVQLLDRTGGLSIFFFISDFFFISLPSWGKTILLPPKLSNF